MFSCFAALFRLREWRARSLMHIRCLWRSDWLLYRLYPHSALTALNLSHWYLSGAASSCCANEFGSCCLCDPESPPETPWCVWQPSPSGLPTLPGPLKWAQSIAGSSQELGDGMGSKFQVSPHLSSGQRSNHVMPNVPPLVPVLHVSRSQSSGVKEPSTPRLDQKEPVVFEGYQCEVIENLLSCHWWTEVGA